MANGFNYKSPIDRLLSVTVPQFVTQQLSALREEKNELRREDRADTKFKAEWDRDETRYQENKAFKETQLDEQRDGEILDSALEITNLDTRNSHLNTLLESGGMRTPQGQKQLEGAITSTSSQHTEYMNLSKGLNIYNLNSFERKNIENSYKQGKFTEGFDKFITAIDRSVDTKLYPEANILIKNLQTEINEYNKALIDPLKIMDEGQKRATEGKLALATNKLSQTLSQFTMFKKEGAQGKPDSTDYGYLQINDKVFDKESRKQFGKPVSDLNGFQNIKLGAWIAKESPRKMEGKPTSGWNNWTVFWKKDEETGEELYKKHLDKPDEYYMSGGISQNELKLIVKEFGDEYDPSTGLKNSNIAKAVMMAESSGDHSSINQNFGDGVSKSLKKEKKEKKIGLLPDAGVPFQGGSEWTGSAVNYIANQLAITPQELKTKYGKFLDDNFLSKFMNEDGSPKVKGVSINKANTYLKNFTKNLKLYSKTVIKADTKKKTVPPGMPLTGEKLNKSVVATILKQKRLDSKKLRGGKAFTEYKWLDKFANQIGFETGEELNSKEGALAMRKYYESATKNAPQDSIDFKQPFDLKIVR